LDESIVAAETTKPVFVLCAHSTRFPPVLPRVRQEPEFGRGEELLQQLLRARVVGVTGLMSELERTGLPAQHHPEGLFGEIHDRFYRSTLLASACLIMASASA